MQPSLAERAAYGDRIRQRAACLMDAYGHAAADRASEAAHEPGLTEQERNFWLAVAGRAQRMSLASAVGQRPRIG